jgi:hypothetical protein
VGLGREKFEAKGFCCFFFFFFLISIFSLKNNKQIKRKIERKEKDVAKWKELEQDSSLSNTVK